MANREKIVYFSDLKDYKDVLEFESRSSFPENGVSGKIYISEDDNMMYRWSEDSEEYVEISSSAAATVTSVNGKDGEVVLTAGDIGYDDGGSGEDTVKDVLDDTYRKDEVNALVQSNAAHYRGYFATWSDVPWDTSLYLEDDDGNRIPGPNDYIAVGDMSDYPDGGDSSSSSDSGSPDAGEYSGAWRMTYSGSWEDHWRNGWQPAFQYNESPLSPQQQAALDSTITKDKVDKLDALPDADTLAGDFAAKQDKLSNAQVSAIDSVVDERKTVVTYADETTLEFDIEGELTSSSITNIENATTVKIGTAVTRIGTEAFYQCYSLASVTIPNSVMSIGGSAFFDCGSLTSVTIPSSVTSIGAEAFYSCVSLTSVTIPSSVTSIGNNAFIGCNNLTNVAIPDSVTSIGDSAFSGCSRLKSATIGNGVTNIGDAVFLGCSGLTNLTFFGKTPTEVQNIEDIDGNKNYPWGITDTSIITTWNDASKEWVETQIPTVPSASTTMPEMDGDASAGMSSSWARGDHVHPTDTSRAAAADLRYRIATAELVAILTSDVTIMLGGNTVTSYDFNYDDDYDGFGHDGFGLSIFEPEQYKTVPLWSGDGTPIGNDPNITFVYGGESTPNPPILLFHHALADRTVNLIAADDETSIDIELQDVQEEGYSRDFYLAVTCGSTAPTLNSPSGVTLVNAKGEEPDLTLTPDATTVLRFTEVADPSEHTPTVFCVTGGANGGGGSLDLSVLVEEFSEESTYEEGDIVQYQGELYLCESAIDTPGPWDSADWVSAQPVMSVLLPMIRGKADSSALDAKAEAKALAPAWISEHAYFKGDHVSYNGLLYECISTVAGSTDPSADTTHWKQTDLAAPDATLDILSDGRLRVVAADGTPMWTQGYALASESAVALSCERINKYVFAATTATAFSDSSTYAVGDRVTYGGKVYKCSTAVETAGAWTAANWDEDPDTQAFALPNSPSGVVGDFVLDVDNTANEVPVMVAISGTLGTTYDLIVEKGRSSVDVLTIEGGALAELYFTMTAFGTAAKPAWRVVRLNVERQEVGS